jgi:hypothetical protein
MCGWCWTISSFLHSVLYIIYWHFFLFCYSIIIRNSMLRVAVAHQYFNLYFAGNLNFHQYSHLVAIFSLHYIQSTWTNAKLIQYWIYISNQTPTPFQWQSHILTNIYFLCVTEWNIQIKFLQSPSFPYIIYNVCFVSMFSSWVCATLCILMCLYDFFALKYKLKYWCATATLSILFLIISWCKLLTRPDVFQHELMQN